ncbi:DNA dC-_dU-editing enzyme APOBEC-3G-like [Muntiacus reevesi]|uniref:DNA dC->dU-editing enzyme APOBEC-3G-like n=1 Tax=Muntiacus reevesi TaxID=9886 RepID=UPI003306D98D
MNRYTFIENFNNQEQPFKTYLCFKVERLDGDTEIPLDEYKRFVRSKGPDQPQGPHHAEFYFLEQIRSRNLDQNQHYRVTCFISWSPCRSCAHNLTTFLKENPHISLHIFASRLYTNNRFGSYQRGLRELQAAGAQITIMTSQDFEHCWETFVNHGGNPFQPWEGLEAKSQELRENLQAILRTQQN